MKRGLHHGYCHYTNQSTAEVSPKKLPGPTEGALNLSQYFDNFQRASDIE